MEIPIEIWVMLAAFLAGFVDSISGGGGLISLPALMLVGLPPQLAIGTNKFQALFGTSMATINFWRHGLIDWRKLRWGVAACFATAFLASQLVVLVPEAYLRRLLPFLLVTVALYFTLKSGLDDQDRSARMSVGTYAGLIAPFIAFYDGIFGPGAGSFYMLGFVMLAGLGLGRANASTKALNLASNFGSFVAFAILGLVDWRLGGLMAVAQMAGGYLGSKLALRVGARLIRPLLVFMTTAMALKMILS